VFGLNASGEIFQKAIFDLIKDLNGVENISDDILVYGKDEQDYDKNLMALLKRLEDRGLTVNPEKCEFGKSKVNFFGFTFSDQGISLDSKKYDALMSASAPKTATELRSFLGLASFCSNFIPRFAELTSLLRELYTTTYTCSEEHERAFQELKLVISRNTLKYFDPKLKTEEVVDASPCVVASVLLQYSEENPDDKKIVL
jgi:hypothetical protein